MSKHSNKVRKKKYRKAGHRGKEGKWKRWLWLAIRFDEQQGLCFFCKEQMQLIVGSYEPPWRATLDHIVGLRFKNGRHTFDNIVASCLKCNSSRDSQ